MKNNFKQPVATGFFALVILFLAFGTFGQRPRVLDKPAPRPAGSPTPTPTPHQVQTLQSLQSNIRLILQRPELRRGHIGVKIVSLDSGAIIYTENAEKYFMPASNMKVFTVAAAIEKLTPGFKFETSVYAPAMPDTTGTIKGDLTVVGRGDISISTAFSNGDYYRGLDDLAGRIAGAGVKRIEGNLVGDESYFTGNAIPDSWEWEDLQWYYGAEISALSVNDNSVDLRVTAGPAGWPCIAQVDPANPIFAIINKCTSEGSKKNLQITKIPGQNLIEITGTIPPGDSGFRGSISVSRPAELFLALLRQRLELKGIVLAGQNRVDSSGNPAAAAGVEIARLESVPLGIIAQKTMKPSQNLYTETILRTLGEKIGRQERGAATSAERGIAVVRQFLNDVGVSADSVIQWDGSGLSRHNLVTPDAVVRVFAFMAKSRFSVAWNASLAVGGVDGTLKNRFTGTSAMANARGKTGTIDQVSSLSGYVNSASGERLVFSIIVNGVNRQDLRQKTIDEIVVALADFDGKTQ